MVAKPFYYFYYLGTLTPLFAIALDVATFVTAMGWRAERRDPRLDSRRRRTIDWVSLGDKCALG
jgi:hypothetical protein